MYKELYELMQKQNEDLAAMVDRYQHETIPQLEKRLEMARAEREAVTKALVKACEENAALQKQLEEAAK